MSCLPNCLLASHYFRRGKTNRRSQVVAEAQLFMTLFLSVILRVSAEQLDADALSEDECGAGLRDSSSSAACHDCVRRALTAQACVQVRHAARRHLLCRALGRRAHHRAQGFRFREGAAAGEAGGAIRGGRRRTGRRNHSLARGRAKDRADAVRVRLARALANQQV